MKVLVIDGVSEEGLGPLLGHPSIEIVIGSKMSEIELVNAIPNYDGLIVRSATRVTSGALAVANRLKIIGRAGVGVDNIDIEAATQRGVLVVNAPDGNTIAAAEHTLAMMLALARHIPQSNSTMKRMIWDKKSFQGTELRGKALGIIGLGRIGCAVARRAQGFEMEVLGYDPFVSLEKAASLGVRLVSFDQLCKLSDFITVHIPKTKDTYHLVNDKAISMMKTGVRIVNCARGGIVDEDALYNGLADGQVAGAAFDVFEEEPNTKSRLLGLANFIATPHLGASTVEAQINVAACVAEEVAAALTGGFVKNAVNIPALGMQSLVKVKPLLGVAEKLGCMHANLGIGRIKRVEVISSDHLNIEEISHVAAAAIKGLLTPILHERVNLVNAALIAKHREILVTHAVAGNSGGYSNLLTVKVSNDLEERTLAGTWIDGNGEVRVVAVDGYRVDVVPVGAMFFISHVDKPRVTASVTAILGEHEINIGTMQVSRKQLGGQAIMFITVDGKVDRNIEREIAWVDGVYKAKFLEL